MKISDLTDSGLEIEMRQTLEKLNANEQVNNSLRSHLAQLRDEKKARMYGTKPKAN